MPGQQQVPVRRPGRPGLAGRRRLRRPEAAQAVQPGPHGQRDGVPGQLLPGGRERRGGRLVAVHPGGRAAPCGQRLGQRGRLPLRHAGQDRLVGRRVQERGGDLAVRLGPPAEQGCLAAERRPPADPERLGRAEQDGVPRRAAAQQPVRAGRVLRQAVAQEPGHARLQTSRPIVIGRPGGAATAARFRRPPILWTAGPPSGRLGRGPRLTLAEPGSCFPLCSPDGGPDHGAG